MGEAYVVTGKTREEITVAQYHIHQEFWKEFGLVAYPLLLNLAGGLIGNAPVPQMPRQPFRVTEIVVRYALELFRCEYDRIPKRPSPEPHYADIAARIENLAAENIREFEKKGLFSLAYHCHINDLIKSVRMALNQHIESLPVVFVEDANSPTGYFGIRVDRPNQSRQIAPPIPSDPSPSSLPEPIVSTKEQLRHLFSQSGMKPKIAAKALGVTVRSINRHLSGTVPRQSHIDSYEKLFTEAIGRPVRIITS